MRKQGADMASDNEQKGQGKKGFFRGLRDYFAGSSVSSANKVPLEVPTYFISNLSADDAVDIARKLVAGEGVKFAKTDDLVVVQQACTKAGVFVSNNEGTLKLFLQGDKNTHDAVVLASALFTDINHAKTANREEKKQSPKNVVENSSLEVPSASSTGNSNIERPLPPLPIRSVNNASKKAQPIPERWVIDSLDKALSALYERNDQGQKAPIPGEENDKKRNNLIEIIEFRREHSDYVAGLRKDIANPGAIYQSKLDSLLGHKSRIEEKIKEFDSDKNNPLSRLLAQDFKQKLLEVDGLVKESEKILGIKTWQKTTSKQDVQAKSGFGSRQNQKIQELKTLKDSGSVNISVQKVAALSREGNRNDIAPLLNNPADIQVKCPPRILKEFQNLVASSPKLLGAHFENPYTGKIETLPAKAEDFTARHLQLLARNETMNVDGIMKQGLYGDALTQDQVARLRCLVKATTVSGLVNVGLEGGFPYSNPIQKKDSPEKMILIDQSGLQWQGDLRNTGGMFFYPKDMANVKIANYATWQADMFKAMYGGERPKEPSTNSVEVKWGGIEGKLDLTQVALGIQVEFLQALEAAGSIKDNDSPDKKVNLRYLKAGMGFFASGITIEGKNGKDNPKLLGARLDGIKGGLEYLQKLPETERKQIIGNMGRLELPFSAGEQYKDKLQEIEKLAKAVGLEWGGADAKDALASAPDKYINASTTGADPHAMPGNEGGYQSVDAMMSMNARIEHLNAAANNSMKLVVSKDFGQAVTDKINYGLTQLRDSGNTPEEKVAAKEKAASMKGLVQVLLETGIPVNPQDVNYVKETKQATQLCKALLTDRQTTIADILEETRIQLDKNKGNLEEQKNILMRSELMLKTLINLNVTPSFKNSSGLNDLRAILVLKETQQSDTNVKKKFQEIESMLPDNLKTQLRDNLKAGATPEMFIAPPREKALEELGSVEKLMQDVGKGRQKNYKTTVEQMADDLIAKTAQASVKIGEDEFYNKQWEKTKTPADKEKSKNWANFANLNNMITYDLVGESIFKGNPSVEEMSNRAVFWAEVAATLVKKGDYSTARGIGNFLESSAFYEPLKSQKFEEVFSPVSEVLSPLGSFKNYRAVVAARVNNDQGYISMPAVMTSNLTPIFEANPDITSDKIFNIEKLKLVTTALEFSLTSQRDYQNNLVNAHASPTFDLSKLAALNVAMTSENASSFTRVQFDFTINLPKEGDAANTVKNDLMQIKGAMLQNFNKLIWEVPTKTGPAEAKNANYISILKAIKTELEKDNNKNNKELRTLAGEMVALIQAHAQKGKKEFNDEASALLQELKDDYKLKIPKKPDLSGVGKPSIAVQTSVSPVLSSPNTPTVSANATVQPQPTVTEFKRAEPKKAEGQEQPASQMGSAARTALEKDVNFDVEPTEKAVPKGSVSTNISPEELEQRSAALASDVNFDLKEDKKDPAMQQDVPVVPVNTEGPKTEFKKAAPKNTQAASSTITMGSAADAAIRKDAKKTENDGQAELDAAFAGLDDLVKKAKKSKDKVSNFGFSSEDLKLAEAALGNLASSAQKKDTATQQGVPVAPVNTAVKKNEAKDANVSQPVEAEKEKAKQDFKLKMVAGEVVSTEETYLKTVKNFFQLIFNSKLPQDELTFKEKLTQFSVKGDDVNHKNNFLNFLDNYEKTITTSAEVIAKSKMLEEFAKAKQENRAPVGLPEGFSPDKFLKQELEPALNVHMVALDKCIEGFPNFLDASAALSKNKEFEKLTSEMNDFAKTKDPTYQGLSATAITTVQRIPRYQLFAREFAKFNGFPEEDYFAAAAFKANNTIRNADNKKMLVEAKEALFNKIKNPESNVAVKDYYSQLTSFLSQKNVEAEFTDSELKTVLKNIQKLNSVYKDNNPNKGPNIVSIMKTSLIDEGKALDTVGQLVSLGCSVRIDSILPLLENKEKEITISLLPEKMRTKNNILNTLDAITTMKEKHEIKVNQQESKEFIAYLAMELSEAKDSKKKDTYEQTLIDSAVKAFGQDFVNNVDQLVKDFQLEAEQNAPAHEGKDKEAKISKRRKLGQTLGAINPLKSRHRESQQTEPARANLTAENISNPVNIPMATNVVPTLPIKPANENDKQKITEWASKVVDFYFKTGIPVPESIEVKSKMDTEEQQLKLLVEAMVVLKANGTQFNLPEGSGFIKQLQDLGMEHAKDVRVMGNVQILLNPTAPKVTAANSQSAVMTTPRRLASVAPPSVVIPGSRRTLTPVAALLDSAQKAYNEYISLNPNKKNDSLVMKISADMNAIALLTTTQEQKRQALEQLLTNPNPDAKDVKAFIREKLGNDLKELPQRQWPPKPRAAQNPNVNKQPQHPPREPIKLMNAGSVANMPLPAIPSQRQPIWTASSIINTQPTLSQAFRMEGAHVDAFQSPAMQKDTWLLRSPSSIDSKNQVEFKPRDVAGMEIARGNNIPSCVATFKPGEGDNPGFTTYGMKPGKPAFDSPDRSKMLEFLVKKAFDAHLENPATKDKVLNVTVLQDMGITEQGKFIDLIKQEAQKRVNDGTLNKDNITVHKAGNSEHIPLDLKSRGAIAKK